MRKLSCRFSRPGLTLASVFLLLASAVFAWVFYSASSNPADSGESGILLLPFAMPWIALVPDRWLGPGSGFGAILFNALILYALGGGVRFTKN